MLQERLPDPLLGRLYRARRRGTEVDVLFRRFRDGAYLGELHGSGMRLFEAGIPDEGPSMLFLDGQRGYTLPGWMPVGQPFSRTYELLWRRIGIVMDVRGGVKTMAGAESLVELEAARPVFLHVGSLRGTDVIREGRAVRALGIAAFAGIRGAALLLDALHVEPVGGEWAAPGLPGPR